jgi:hypothetical protein
MKSANLSLKGRTLDLIVMAIRCVPLKRDHPSSLIQIPKFRERPWIVPPEVHDGLHVVARALSPKRIISYSRIK